MSEAKHAPLPWTFDELPEWGEIYDANGGLIATVNETAEEIKADAEFIVRAVNCHDELLEALQLFLQGATRIDYDENSWVFVEAVDAARAAIAKATGE